MAGASRITGCLAVLVLVAGCGSGSGSAGSEEAADRGDYVLWHGTTYVTSCQATPDTILGPALGDVRFDFPEGSNSKAADFSVYPIRGVDPEQVLGLRGPTSKCAGEPEPGELIAVSGATNGAYGAAPVEAAVEAAEPL